MGRLSEKIAIVTGGGRGIGRGIVLALAELQGAVQADADALIGELRQGLPHETGRGRAGHDPTGRRRS